MWSGHNGLRTRPKHFEPCLLEWVTVGCKLVGSGALLQTWIESNTTCVGFNDPYLLEWVTIGCKLVG